MIKSDAQLERTLAQIAGFRANMEAEQADRAKPAAMRRIVVESLGGMIAKLEHEVREYQELRRGIIRMPPLFSVKELGPHLLKVRIALRITQEDLAERVGVTRQTINKHEEHEYQSASGELIAQVASALGLVQRLQVTHPTLEIKEPELVPA